MTEDLMMKAAIQFKGVWPENEYCEADEQRIGLCLDSYREDSVYEKGSLYPVGCGATTTLWSIVCTREQFEAFVESLFEGAPDDAEMYVEFHHPQNGYKGFAYKNNLGNYELMGTETWISKLDVEIPRPAKKAEPQAPWVPEIGEECKSALLGSHFTVGRLLYKSDQLVIWQDSATGAEFAGKLENRMFRPLRTERELFIEQATRDYLDQVGSDAVNAKWFERIFGALYDAGNLSYKN